MSGYIFLFIGAVILYAVVTGRGTALWNAVTSGNAASATGNAIQ